MIATLYFMDCEPFAQRAQENYLEFHSQQVAKLGFKSVLSDLKVPAVDTYAYCLSRNIERICLKIKWSVNGKYC